MESSCFNGLYYTVSIEKKRVVVSITDESVKYNHYDLVIRSVLLANNPGKIKRLYYGTNCCNSTRNAE